MRHYLLLFALMLLGCGEIEQQAAPVQPREWGEPKTLAQIKDPRISESSGVAASLTRPGVFYTHNDSGDRARFFAFDRSGKVLAEYELEGAQNIDWEDMASARIGGKNYLYFGDIGDNARRRNTIVVYRVEEPGDPAARLDHFETYTLEYPDGPHNAEALMVHPGSGDLTIVTKSSGKQSQVFRARSPRDGTTTRLQEVGTIGVGGSIEATRLITGGDISPDGRYVVVRTYAAAYEWPLERWFKDHPVKIKTNLELVGEGICYEP
ncbi:MAG TPA: hypothetical protein VM328_02880, partial [Fimbriimonadaceae bacterium]|nr:hypothetical protein [Fimbriimonadaceae bacterium]